MSDLKNPKVIIAKGLLFLFLGTLASALLLLLSHDFRIAILLAIAIWAFCRFYYFAFYVIQNYVDADYKFSGLYSFAKYLAASRSIREK